MNVKTPYLFEFPWPPAALSPNARGHWFDRAKTVHDYRTACRILARAQMALRPGAYPLPAPVRMHLQFHPPRRGRYDADNLVARFKAGIDGMVDARLLHGDDAANLVLEGVIVGVPLKGGAVCVALERAEP